MIMTDSGSASFFIGGVRVNFPIKPYPSQVAMMGQIIKGLNRSENCLLESPTGTGKSLALLCSTLAWQTAEEDRVSRYNALIDQGITDQDILNRVYNPTFTANATQNLNASVTDSQPTETQNTTLTSTQGTTTSDSTSIPLTGSSTTGTSASDGTSNVATGTNDGSHNSTSSTLGGGFVRDPNYDDDDFRDNGSRFRSNATPDNTFNETQNFGMAFDEDPENLTRQTNQPRKKRTPKIFFGTRTHKQIFQIIRELRKTEYQNVRSVVLGSRDHTCIHPVVSKSKSKNEGCKELLENKEGSNMCSFYHGVNRIRTHDQLNNMGYPPVWDLEDLVKIGKRVKACPYFAARHLMETAQIVFCPYNYLIDPLIRESMNIDLRKNILVLDEAHNVEDSSRAAASNSFTQDAVVEAKSDLEKLFSYGVKPEMCEPLIKMLSNISLWMDSNKNNLTDYSEFGKNGKIFSGEDMVKNLSHLDVEPKDLSKLENCLNKLTEETEDDSSYKPAAATSQLLSGLFLILKYMFKNDMKYVSDYKVALVRMQTFSKKKFSKNVNGWIERKSGPSSDFVYSLNFWCLNPGVAFSELGVMTRSIVLTSGTLSPMNSFESELSVKFHIKFEGNHVINKEQVWVGTISKGPTNHVLNATFKHSETWAFQDELGRLLLEICESIPRGVLCFLPSYAMLDKLIDRWQKSSIWEQIERVKIPITEPRNSEDFENSIKLFYNTIEETRNSKEGVNGALFIAVCRGKVSEGLDFADDNARAVIAVGIPFPNTKDIQVNLKRQYNDKYSKSKGLLSGAEWYEIQAYRALNQALGRCIRHRHDWGALILVDERYQWQMAGSVNNRYVKGLSKWVRHSLQHETIFSATVSQLKQFSKRMIEYEQQRKSEYLELNSDSFNNNAETPKPKFTTPPIFKNKNKKNEDKVEHNPNLILQIKDGNFEMPKPQEILLLTPIKNGDGASFKELDGILTPITFKNPDSLNQSHNTVYPLTSTQITQNIQPHNSKKLIICINKQDNSVHNSTSTPNSTSDKNLLNQFQHFPIFQSANKRRKCVPIENCLLASPLRGSPIKKLVNISKDDLIDISPVGKENKSSYSSDDLFPEEIIDKTESEIKNIDLNKSTASTKKTKRKLSKRSRSKMTESVEKQATIIKSQTLTRCFVSDSDSDLDDFNLNTSIIVSSRTSKGKRTAKGKHKGVVFSDFE